jgi:hypothetical protein
MTWLHVCNVVVDPDFQGRSVEFRELLLLLLFFREQGNVYHGPNNIPDKVNGVKVDYSDNIVLHAFT